MSTTNILGGLVFSAIGFVAFAYGKKQAQYKTLSLGIALIAFPYFVSNTIVFYAMGAALTAALFIFRD